jgi:hypothetical protein
VSRLGGFDFVCQLRRDKLLNLMEENGLKVQGNTLATPFRLAIKGPPSGFPPRPSNTVDLLVKSVDLALSVGTNLCTLILQLEGGVIRLPGEPDAAFTGGAVNVQMQLVDGTFILVRILSATLDAPATPVIAGIANFAARANSEVNKLVNAERNIDVDIYPDAGLIKQMLVVFSKNQNLDADTFCAHLGGNDAGTLTSTLGSNTSVSYAISAGTVIALLPTAEQLSQPHVTITEVNYVFRDGGIDVNGKFDGHDTCWSVRGGSFSQSLIPSLVGQNFVFRPDPPDHPTPKLDFHLELNFLCLVGKAAIDFLDFTFTQAFFVLFGPTLAKALGIHGGFVPPATPTQTRPGLVLGGVTWNDFQVSSEGFILLGDLAGGGVVSAVQQPAIHIRTNDAPANLHAVAQGTVTVQGPTCAPKAFDYVESIQDDQNTLTVDTNWVFEPVEYTWTVNGQALTPAGNVVFLGNRGSQELDYTGTVKVALPPPNGTAIYGHSIKLTYVMSGRTLRLYARNEDANYDIRVEVRATDALGRTFSDAVNLSMVGDIVEFGQDYEDYMDACVKAATDLVNKKGRQQGKVKPGEPQEHWRDLVDAVTQQALEANVEAQALVPGMMKAVGLQAVGNALGRVSVKQIQQ